KIVIFENSQFKNIMPEHPVSEPVMSSQSKLLFVTVMLLTSCMVMNLRPRTARFSVECRGSRV
ncbi:MAG: hypothetical protein PUF63_00360, partial [Prevotella sp.]|nr:hypothetical protein [Prevotella sp.]